MGFNARPIQIADGPLVVIDVPGILFIAGMQPLRVEMQLDIRAPRYRFSQDRFPSLNHLVSPWGVRRDALVRPLLGHLSHHS